MTLKSILFSFVLLSCTFRVNPRPAGATPIKAAVVRSTGTLFLGQTIWNDLNTGWANFGNTQVQIDYTSLAGNGLTLSQITNTQADVLIISAAGFMSYTDAEVNAVKDYVESGHGIIITYDSFMTNKRAWAPLVGLSDTVSLGGNTWPDPFSFNLLAPDHPLFSKLSGYTTGVPFLASPGTFSPGWQLTAGTVLAQATPSFQEFTGNGLIVVNEGENYRGLYFPHYIEDKADGSNLQDMQVFYNGLLWTAGVPEPGSLLLGLGAGVLFVRKRRRT